jgi:hypothetical protein
MSKTIKQNDWRVEDRFRQWGKPLKKTGDEFDDWALQVWQENAELKLEDELRELFMEDLHGKST